MDENMANLDSRTLPDHQRAASLIHFLGFGILRTAQILFLVLFYSPALLMIAFTRDRRRQYSAIGRFLRRVLASSGGALPKFGQILSTRPDLLPAELCKELAFLQDGMPEITASSLYSILREAPCSRELQSLNALPEATGTIAQVHRACLNGIAEDVALKIMRPGIAHVIEVDCALAVTLLPFLQKLPNLCSIPVRDAVQMACSTIQRQTDFHREARNLDSLRQDLSVFPEVVVPAVHWNECSDQVLSMEYVKGLRKITDPTIPDAQARELIKVGLHCLYRMIFETGRIHCDLHPGNLMVNENGRLVVLDAGLVIEITPETRASFAEFFVAIALRNGRRAANVVRTTATAVPATLDRKRFDADIDDLIQRTGGLSARNFQIAAFVAELFAIQERHGMLGTSRFSMIILAMLVFEGTAKQRYGTLEFQKEAIPFVMDVLIRKPVPV